MSQRLIEDIKKLNYFFVKLLDMGYNVVDAQDTCMTIKVLLNAGHQMKYHSHMRRDEVWTIVSGTGTVILDDQKSKVSVGDVVKVPRGCKHTIIAETTLNIIEVQIGEDIDVKDKEVFANIVD